MTSAVWGVFDTRQKLLALFNSRELAVDSIKFSYHKVKGVKFEFDQQVNRTLVTVVKEGRERQENLMTIQLLYVYSEVEHI